MSPSRSAASEGGPIETLDVKVMSIAPLHAFREATRASARVIERDGRRIGYVHVWASVGEESEQALARRAVAARRQRMAVRPKGGKARPVARLLDGLIVDMRGKIGGTGQHGRALSWTCSTRAARYSARADKSQTSRAMTAAARPHRRPHRSSHAQHGRAVRACLQARAAGPADRHAHRRRRQRGARLRHAGRQPALPGRVGPGDRRRGPRRAGRRAGYRGRSGRSPTRRAPTRSSMPRSSPWQVPRSGARPADRKATSQ